MILNEGGVTCHSNNYAAQVCFHFCLEMKKTESPRHVVYTNIYLIQACILHRESLCMFMQINDPSPNLTCVNNTFQKILNKLSPLKYK